MRQNPKTRSSGMPRLSNPDMLRPKWMSPAWSQLHESSRHHSPRSKMATSFFAPIALSVLIVTPIIKLASHGCPSSYVGRPAGPTVGQMSGWIDHPFAAISARKTREQANVVMRQKIGA